MTGSESAASASMEPAWLEDLFASIDAKDAQAFADFLTPDAVFLFGNGPEVRGREAIIHAVSDFFASLKGLRHTLGLVVSQPGIIVVCGQTTYTRHDDREVTVPFADTFAMLDDKISHYQIYADVAPLYAD